MYGIVAYIALGFAMGSGAADDASSPKNLLRQLRFSPDGRYVLAQDVSEITILTVEPLAILFRIPAEQAEFAQFTPDSQQVVFLSSTTKVDPLTIAYKESGAHVERWSIAGQRRVASANLPTMVCGTQQLSPAGDVLVCLDLEGRLRLFDVASGQTIFDKKKFEILIRQDPAPEWGELGVAHIGFSPDAHFVVVKPEWADGPVLLFDVRERKSARLMGALKLLKDHWYAWMAPDRILVEHGFLSKSDKMRGYAQGRVVAFPSGKVVSQPRVPNGEFYPTADADFILTRSFGARSKVTRTGPGFLVEEVPTNRSAATQLSTAVVIISNTPALDVFGHSYVAEPNAGEVGLYEIGKGLQARVALRKK